LSKQQTVQTTPWWKNKKIIFWTIITTVLLEAIAFIVFIAIPAGYNSPGTGFSSSKKTTTITERDNKGIITKETTTEEDQPAKTFWDWLPLLIQLLGALAIPIAVGFGSVYFTTRQAQISEANRKQQHETDLQIAEKQQQQEFLQTYFDKMAEMLEKGLRKAQPDDEIRYIAQARTLAALRRLDAEHNRILLKFLFSSKLIQRRPESDIIELKNTDLSTVQLHKADLSQVDLRQADLSETRLSEADLFGADLRLASLSEANLSEANLQGAIFQGANPRDSRLRNIKLPQDRQQAPKDEQSKATVAQPTSNTQRKRQSQKKTNKAKTPYSEEEIFIRY
jgi:uncharacterized protein YjbI with pentapeptide repeats